MLPRRGPVYWLPQRLALARLVKALALTVEHPQHAVAEVPGAEHPGRDVGLRASGRVAEHAPQLGLLLVAQELLVAGAGGPFVEAAVQRRQGCEGHVECGEE